MAGYVTDSERQIKQKEAILLGAPWAIAHKSMLEVNKPHKFTLNQQDYVIWKDNCDEVYALENICPHMQAPLSDGWICSEGKTITCPFHGLKFDSEGRLKQETKTLDKNLIQPLKLIIKEDFIWTYGNYQPRLPVPNLITDLTKKYLFLGVAGEKIIKAPFLNCLKINYDFNHAIATHKEPFKFKSIETTNYQENGYYTRLDQQITTASNTWREVINNPVLLSVPKTLHNHFEYAFPSTTCVSSRTSLGELLQLFILYPVNESLTKTYVLVYLKPKNKLIQLTVPLFKDFFLKSFGLVIEQDSSILESLYPQQKSHINLPREEIMFYAKKLYSQWDLNR